jgi:hypothetical protein
VVYRKNSLTVEVTLMNESTPPTIGPATLPRLLNLQQASDLIHRDRTALHNDVRAGKLPAIRVGRMWLVTEADLLEFDKKPRVGRDLPRGPRSKLSDPQVADELERLLEAGASVVDAMRVVGVDQPRYYREDRTNPGFRARMETARARAASKRASDFADAWRISTKGSKHASLGATPGSSDTSASDQLHHWDNAELTQHDVRRLAVKKLALLP